jgi:hypothetical protein
VYKNKSGVTNGPTLDYGLLYVLLILAFARELHKRFASIYCGYSNAIPKKIFFIDFGFTLNEIAPA